MLKILKKRRGKKSIIAVLDIGSSKIVCLISYIKPNGRTKVIGIGHSESNGFKSGIIIDRKLAEDSIITAVDIAEKMCGINIDKIVITFSSKNIKSTIINTKLPLGGDVVYERDIHNIIKHVIDKFSAEKLEVIHYFPLEFSVDDIKNITNPIGIFGYELVARINLITLPMSIVYNLVSCLADCHLDLDDIIAAPYVSGFSCLTDEEREEGVTLIDIGGATTSCATFYKNNLVYTTAIPLGGDNVTSDIAKILFISTKNAERIKNLHGSTIVTFADNYKMIDLQVVSSDLEKREVISIPNSKLNKIIAARMEEIFSLLIGQIDKSGIDRSLLEKIVITGGGASISGMKEFAMNKLRSKIRIAEPIAIEGMDEVEDLSSFATSMGVLRYLANQNHNRTEVSNLIEKKQSILDIFLSWFKENC